MPDEPLTSDLTESVRDAWHRFLRTIEPLRPELFRASLRLTGSVFDAEDLVHEGLLRAFGSVAFAYGDIENPRGYLLRVLSNVWIDELRRARPEPVGDEIERATASEAPPDRSPEVREAAETILGFLTPRERVAVVLKDIFQFRHAEIAEIISTSEAAVKVALHRGRGRLAEARTFSNRPRVSHELVDRFVELFRAHDIDGLTALLSQRVETHNFPVGAGRDVVAAREWLFGCFYHHIPEREAAGDPFPLRLEVARVEEESVVLVFRDYGESEALEEVWRLEEDGGSIVRIRDYCFSPDVVHHVAERLGLPFRLVGYRFNKHAYRDPVYR